MHTKIELNKGLEQGYSLTKDIKGFLTNNMVTIMFLVLSFIGYRISGMNPTLYFSDIIARISRNSFLVLSLIIPVVAGMGLNFSIVLGAMAAQTLIIFVTHWGYVGLQGIIICVVLVTPLSITIGYLTGKLFNKAKGQEMITGLILGYFAQGIYELFFLQLVGTIIPMENNILVLSSGVGIRTTVDLSGGLKYGLDHVYRMPLPNVFIAIGVIGLLYLGYNFFKSNRGSKDKVVLIFGGLLCIGAFVSAYMMLISRSLVKNIPVPIVTWAVIIALCIFLYYFLGKTKLGQDLRAVGQDRHVAEVSGIQVDKVRIIAVIMSMVIASWGHIIFLQNMGAFSTYGSHESIGLYSTAAILIGGATVVKATIGQALLGVFLFHTLFIVSPAAGRQIFGDAQVGEYFRVFVAYGVIGVSLVMHAWKTRLLSKQG